MASFFQRLIAVSLLLAGSVSPRAMATEVTLAQNIIAQTDTEAQKLFDEGMALVEEGSAESLQQAISKWEQALPLSQKLGNKEQEAVLNLVLGRAYNLLGFNQKAVEYYHYLSQKKGVKREG